MFLMKSVVLLRLHWMKSNFQQSVNSFKSGRCRLSGCTASADPLYSGFILVLDLAAQVELQTPTTAWLPLCRCGEQHKLSSTKDKNGSSRMYEVAPPVETKAFTR